MLRISRIVNVFHRSFATAPKPQPQPMPLGNKADQLEFARAVRAQEQLNGTPEAFEEVEAARKTKIAYEGFDGDVNPLTGEVRDIILIF
jgi:hypothetical protein